MTQLFLRRLVLMCVGAAAAMVVLVVPGVANAGTLGEQCSGSNITADGATMQKDAQQLVWDPGFHTSSDAKACSGTQGSKGKPTVKYEPIGSGSAMEAWGVNKHTFEGSVAFVGTDEPPNAQQREEIQSHSEHPSEETLETIPVAQEALTIIVHLPTGCTATSESPGRLALDNVTLEKIFRGVITKWSEITEYGDKLEGTGCSPTSTISPVVREEQAGTTSILKKYLFLIHPEANLSVEVEGKKEEKSWKQLSEGALSTVWPASFKRQVGDGGMARRVAETPSTIGYSGLANVRGVGSFTPSSGGANTERFWVLLQNNGLAQEGASYADPSTNREVDEVSRANCVNAVYEEIEKEIPFPPASTLELWNMVTSRTHEERYPLCALTYDLTLKTYSKYPGTTLEEATTVNNFMQYVLAGSGGQESIKDDYYPLPTSLAAEARIGANATSF